MSVPPRSLHFRFAAIALLFAAIASPAAAQTTYQWNKYNGGVWSDASSWLPGSGFLPDLDTTLEFDTNSSLQTLSGYTSIFDGSFNINAMNFDGMGGGGSTISLLGGSAGSTIRFNRSSTSIQPQINLTGLSSVSISNGSATAGMTLVGAGTRLQIVGAGLGQLNIAASIVESGGSAGIDINRGSAGAYGTASGWTILSGNNTFSGGVNLQSGNLVVGSNNALGTGTFTISGANSTLRLTNSPTLANTIQLDQTLTITGGETGSYTGGTLSGLISGTGGLTVRPNSGFITLNLTNANSLQGPFVAQPMGNSSAFINLTGNGTMSNASSYTLSGYTNFTFGGSSGPATGRINPNAVLTSNGGFIFYSGNSSGVSSETFRRWEVSGSPYLQISSGSNGETSLRFTEGIVLQPGATLDLSPNEFGGAITSTSVNLYLGVAPSGMIGGGGATGTTTRSILPYAISAFKDGSLLVSGGFVGWDASLNRMVSLQSSEYSSALSTTRNTNPNVNIRLTGTSALPPTGSVSGLYTATTINSLDLTTYTTSNLPFRETAVGVSIMGSAPLTVQSGAIVTATFGGFGVGIPSIIDTGSLNFGSATGYLHGSGKVNSPITGTGGVSIGGSWALTSLTSNFTGDVFVNGVLSIANDANLGAASNAIRLNGGAGQGTLSFTPEVLYGNGLNRTLTINRPIILGPGGGFFQTSGSGGSLVASSNRELTLSGAISGSGAFKHTSFGIISLTGLSNTYAGGTTVNGGVLRVAGDGSLGAASGAVQLYGGSFEPLNSFSTSRDFLLSDSGSGRFNSFFTNGQNLTVNGQIHGLTENAASSPLTKVGQGTLNLTATNTFSGPVIIGDGRDGFSRWLVRVFPTSATGAQTAGTLQLSGANGSLAMATAFFVDPGAVLHLDNSAGANNFRIGAVPIRLNGGELRLTGNSSADVNQWIGGIQAGDTSRVPLAGTVTLDQSAGTNRKSTLTALSLTPTLEGMTFFRGTNLGGTSGNRTQVLFATGPALFNGLIPSAVGATDPNGSPTDFLTTTASGTQSELKLFSSYSGNIPSSVGATTATYDQTASTNVTGAVAANAIRLGSGGGISLGGQTLTIGSSSQAGAILALPGNTGMTGGTVAFGTRAASVTASGDLTFGTAGSPITLTGSAGFSKFGSGILTVTGTNSIVDSNSNADLVVSQGTYRMGSASALPNLARVVIGDGATLDLNGFNATMQDLNGYGRILMPSGSVLNLTGSTAGAPQAFAGAFEGAGSLRIPIGAGSIYVLAGNSPSFTGAVEVQTSALGIESQLAIGVGTSPILLGNTTNNNFAQISFGAAVTSVSRDMISQTAGAGTGNRFINFGANVSTYSGTLTLNAPNTFLFNGQGGTGTILNMTGKITGPGKLSIGSNNSNINLWAINDYSGGTSVSLEKSQVLGIGTNSPFGSGLVTIDANQQTYPGYFRADFGARSIANNITIAGLNGFGVTGPNDLTFTGTLTPPNNNSFGMSYIVAGTGRAIFAGSIAAAGTTNMYKVGPGTMVISTTGGNSSLSSPWNVYAGTLVANSTSATSTGSGAVNVYNGAILAGGGRIGGATTINTGGIIQGGATETGFETLTINNSLTLSAGSTIQMNVKDGAASRLIANAVSTTSPVTISLRNLGLINGQAYSFEVIRTTSSTPFTLAHFSIMADFDFINASVTQTSTPSVLFINFTPVPEPGSIFMLIGISGGAYGLIRRYRKNQKTC